MNFVRNFTLLSVLLAIAPLAAQEKEDLDLPIQRVLMFNSGVSFFEHSGKVAGDATVELKFNVEDVNDLLKSMVLQDLGGGTVSTVTYGSRDPITRTLQTFSIDLTGNPTLADLLRQVRGERVELDAPTKVAGVIVGVETRQRRVGDNETIQEDYLTLLGDDGLRSIPLADVGRIKLADENLDAELRKALAVLASGKSKDKKTVTLGFSGKGERPVRVGYVQESPIWKTSYRLVLDENEQPLLQGWAIVENTTEADWEDVELTLVSGRPISFVMDLYEPLYINRPVVEPELFASLRPQTYHQDLAKADEDFRRRAAASVEKELADRLARQQRGYGQAAGKPSAADKKAKWNLEQGVQSVASAGDVGEMVQYAIDSPVTLARGRSAMLPIINDKVSGKRLSIYNQSVHEKHPLAGLRLKNTSDLHLMQGPITVFDSGAYGGDAQIMDLAPGSERLISYAMDLHTEVAPTTDPQKKQLISLRLVKGTLTSNHKYTQTNTFTIKNSGQKEKTVLIEHPINSYWTLVSPKMPDEKTRDMYRFAVQAEPGTPVKLEVVEEHLERQSVAVTKLDSNTIGIYLSAPEVSEDIKTALREVVKHKQAVEQVARDRQEIQRQITVVDQEQNRIRQNMAQLDRNSDLYRRYVTKFTEQEDRIEALRQQMTDSIAKEQKLRKALDDYLIGLDLN